MSIVFSTKNRNRNPSQKIPDDDSNKTISNPLEPGTELSPPKPKHPLSIILNSFDWKVLQNPVNESMHRDFGEFDAALFLRPFRTLCSRQHDVRRTRGRPLPFLTSM
jgi:hypothetical protein